MTGRKNKLHPVLSYSHSKQENKLVTHIPMNVTVISPLWPAAFHWSRSFLHLQRKVKEGSGSELADFIFGASICRVSLHDIESFHMSTQCRQDFSLFHKASRGGSKSCQTVGSHLNPYAKSLLSKKRNLHQSVSKCKLNIVQRITKEALIKK